MRFAALELLALGFLAMAPPAQATMIVDTVLQSSNSMDPTALPTQWVAQRCLPQTSATLDSVTLRMGRLPPYVDQVDPTAELWVGSAAAPAFFVGALTFPGVAMPMSADVFADERYLRRQSPGADGQYLILGGSEDHRFHLCLAVAEPTNVAACNPVNCGSAFAPENRLTVDGGATWLDDSGLTSKMQVNVTEVSSAPEPATFWLLAPLGILALLRPRSQKR